ncbi:hypothetical protein O3G_MSEX007062 [Manduca sexta]|uniref:Adipokinetic hormone 1 n=1 Tax=Manduca sexta TaxID=7130 RepID=A0A921Z4T3_MANSE|nr:hypothetical protein O3G_MSEX007062 [Manduca sexta]
MYKLSVFLVVVACLCLVAHAQLTFTSSWGGKRAALTGTLSCRNVDVLQAIYKMIQNEAERFIVCQKS